MDSKVWHKLTYLQNRNTLADVENTVVVPKGERGKDWQFKASRCKLFYIRWINNKDLLYSTRNYIQSSVMNHNQNIYIYV